MSANISARQYSPVLIIMACPVPERRGSQAFSPTRPPRSSVGLGSAHPQFGADSVR
jgi:hypothetical protein